MRRDQDESLPSGSRVVDSVELEEGSRVVLLQFNDP